MTDVHWASAHGSSAMTPAMVSLGSSSAPPSGQRRACSLISLPQEEMSDTPQPAARYQPGPPPSRAPRGEETLRPPPPPPPHPPPPHARAPTLPALTPP